MIMRITAEDVNVSAEQIMVSQDPVDFCLCYVVRASGLREGLEAKCVQMFSTISYVVKRWRL